MTVYVDSMRAPLRGMIVCHMLADTDEELHAMAQAIGMDRRRHQKAGTPHSHYDIPWDKRGLAIELGAVEIGRREVGELIRKKRAMVG